MKSFGNSLNSKSVSIPEILLVVAALCALVTVWAWYIWRGGYILYYGDAQAHLNNSRSIFDSQAPGYDQLGTVWLPMLHVLCLPFVHNMTLWSTGLAGTIPVAFCFVVAGLFLYLTARHVHQAILPASLTLLCFALNPNVLYLSVIPLTEMVFSTGLAVLLYAGVKFSSTDRTGLLLLGVLASWWMSLTRYDGWFLIPFAAAWFALSGRKHRTLIFLLFASLASLAPVYWMAHSWWETANALDFFNGPYSAKAIQHGQPYPGFHDWPRAFLYYGKAAQLCTGWALVTLGIFGCLLIRTRAVLLPTCFLLLPCAFYIWSIHSSGNPIHVPTLYPFSYYNTRYGIAFTFFAAFSAGSLTQFASKLHLRMALVIPVIAIAPWLITPNRENWICWKESQVNSVSRRAWTKAASQFVSANYRKGQGILAPFGDVAGIFCRSETPLAQVLHEGNGPFWFPTITRPDLLHGQLWAIAQQGDGLDRSLSGPWGSVYSVVQQIQVPGAPTLNIYKRKH